MLENTAGGIRHISVLVLDAVSADCSPYESDFILHEEKSWLLALCSVFSVDNC